MDTDIVFDAASGFSETEQREILENIEAITRKDPIALTPDTRKLEAKKQGGRFPILVNLGGLVLLAGGFLLLSFFYRQDESEIRGGIAPLNITDRNLIREIRRENESRIRDKEREISDILSKLSGVDGDLQSLQSAMAARLVEREADLRQQMDLEINQERDRLVNQNLSEAAIAEQMRIYDAQQIARLNVELAVYQEELDGERRAGELTLQKLREEYRSSLAGLQAERAGILEASRVSEADLKAQLEEKTGELTQQYEQNREDLNLAREELRRLTDEQERSALVERQMSGFYTLVQAHMREGTPEKALETLALMREFLETPAFQTIRAIQFQKEGHLAAINSLSAVVEGLLGQGPRPVSAGPDPREEEIAALREENAALTQTIADRTGEINVYRSQGTELTRTMQEFEGTISTLRSQNTTQSQTISAQERDLNALRTQNTTQAQTISAHERDLSALRSQNTAQAQTISAHERDLSALRNENTAQAQTITEQTQQINSLRTTNTSLFQAMENLQQALDTARQLQENQ
jgi:chromosome segregation ATPase